MQQNYQSGDLSSKCNQPIQNLNNNNTSSNQYCFDGMQKCQIWAYGVGHTLNDLTATCWFNYLFFFLKKILMVESAASTILWGQVLDGLATPIVGHFSDKVNTRIGQRKPWYIASILLLFASTVLLFSGYKSNDAFSEAVFYISMGIIYGLGFAGLQISHMSLVPSLTCSRKRRDQLNNLRNLFTFISNFTVLGFGLFIFSLISDKLLKYQILAYFSSFLGLAASLYFVFAIDQPKLVQICIQRQTQLKNILINSKDKKELDIIQSNEKKELSEYKTEDDNNDKLSLTQKSFNIYAWFKMPKFYLYGFCYVSARMYINMFGTLIPFYISDVLKMVDSRQQNVSYNLALIPMLVYAASVLVSCKLNHFYRSFGRKKSLFLGTFICVMSSVVMCFIDKSNSQLFYIIAVLMGASQSLVLSTGVNLISDVVGSKAQNGAFVFGIYSMIDKIVVGLGIYIVGTTQAYSKNSNFITFQDMKFIKWTFILVPSISCLVSSLILLTTSVEQYALAEQDTTQLTKNKIDILSKQLVL